MITLSTSRFLMSNSTTAFLETTNAALIKNPGAYLIHGGAAQ